MKDYIADPHFGHNAIFRLNNRLFSTVEEMDNTMLSNWQSIVKSDDEVYILGDLIFRAKNSPEYYLNKLTGKKHLILGNHDKWSRHVDLDSSS
jgi:calcineurin-like phosphoesterase family protein